MVPELELRILRQTRLAIELQDLFFLQKLIFLAKKG